MDYAGFTKQNLLRAFINLVLVQPDLALMAFLKKKKNLSCFFFLCFIAFVKHFASISTKLAAVIFDKAESLSSVTSHNKISSLIYTGRAGELWVILMFSCVGRSYCVRTQRMLNQCLESLVQKVQSGVVINFEKSGPDPAPIGEGTVTVLLKKCSMCMQMSWSVFSFHPTNFSPLCTGFIRGLM